MEAKWTTESTHPTTNGLDQLIKGDDGTYIGWAYNKQNAHLIAAAPELYAALESARAWADFCGAQAGLQNILDEIDAALAKARGEQ